MFNDKTCTNNSYKIHVKELRLDKPWLIIINFNHICTVAMGNDATVFKLFYSGTKDFSESGYCPPWATGCV